MYYPINWLYQTATTIADLIKKETNWWLGEFMQIQWERITLKWSLPLQTKCAVSEFKDSVWIIIWENSWRKEAGAVGTTFRKQNEKEREKWEIEIPKQANGNISVWVDLVCRYDICQYVISNILAQFEASKRNWQDFYTAVGRTDCAKYHVCLCVLRDIRCIFSTHANVKFLVKFSLSFKIQIQCNTDSCQHHQSSQTI